MLIWESYFHPSKAEQWLSACDKMSRINDHVIQDIQDYIMLEAYKGKTISDIRKIIEADLAKRKYKKGKSKEEEEEEKHENKKRRFLEQMRPPHIWNFFDPNAKSSPHILRAEADPFKCYADGRIESVMEDIQTLGIHLSKHEDARWKMLVKLTLDIFKAEYKRE